jgi:hypothetical protein
MAMLRGEMSAIRCESTADYQPRAAITVRMDSQPIVAAIDGAG